MGWFSSNNDGMSRECLDKLLHEIPELDHSEREYIKGVMAHYYEGGITREEIVKAINQLKFNHTDPIDSVEAEKIKNKLLEYLDNK